MNVCRLRPLVLATALSVVAPFGVAVAEEYMLLVPPLNSIKLTRPEATTEAPVAEWHQLSVFENGVRCSESRDALLLKVGEEQQRAAARFLEYKDRLPEGPSESWSAEEMAFYRREVIPVGMDSIQKTGRFWQMFLGKCVGGSHVGFRDRK